MAELDADDVIAQLYTAALDSRQWDSAFVAIARLAGARAAGCLVQDAVTEQMLGYRLVGLDDTAWADVYPRYYHSIDPAYRILQQKPPGQMYPMHRYLPDAFVSRSEYFQDFYIRFGMRYSCGGSIYHDGKRLILSAHRPVGHRPYEDDKVDALQRVLKHLPNVFRTREMTAHARHQGLLSIAALDSIQQPLVILDKHLQIHYMNPHAAQLLDGSAYLRVSGGALVPTEARLAHDLAHRIREACKAKGKVYAAPLCMVDKHGRPALEIGVAPLHPELAEQIATAQPMALVVLRCPFGPVCADLSQLAMRPYDLSPAEMVLALAFAEGLTPGEYAARNGVKISTVRSQIQSILAKTGTRRTTEIAILFSALVLPVSDDDLAKIRGGALRTVNFM